MRTPFQKARQKRRTAINQIRKLKKHQLKYNDPNPKIGEKIEFYEKV